MSPIVGYSKDDVEVPKPLNEGDYLFQIDNIEVTSADDTKRGSMIVHLSVLDGPDVKGRTVTRYFNLPSAADKQEKAKDGRSMYGVLLSFLEDFIVAAGGKWTAKGFDTAELMGRQLRGTVEHEEYEGRIQGRFRNWKSA